MWRYSRPRPSNKPPASKLERAADRTSGCGEAVEPDDEDQELRDLDEARVIAISGVRPILGEDLAGGLIDLDGGIDITDVEGDVLLSLPYSNAIEIRGRTNRR